MTALSAGSLRPFGESRDAAGGVQSALSGGFLLLVAFRWALNANLT